MDFEKTLPLMPRLSRYQILREIGRGTMGIVYEAFDPNLERTVALKTVRLEANGSDHSEFEQRFQREAKSAGRINHPNIVTIHDAGKEGEIAYIAMEFLVGKTLREIIDSGERPKLEETLSYAEQIADGIDYAHRSGIIHRDIKPANILVSADGRIKITDFGIAQLPTGDLTQAGTLLGTPKYMSPEQLRGEKLDGRSDIFSFGVILYELLTGLSPFSGETLASIMYKILHEAPEDPMIKNPECPAGVCQILARCLAKDREQRYAEAGEIARDLRRHAELPVDPQIRTLAFRTPQVSAVQKAASQDPTLQMVNVVLPERPAITQAKPSALRRKWPLLAAAGAALILVVSLAAWHFYSTEPEPMPDKASPIKTEPAPPRKDAPAAAPADSSGKPAVTRKAPAKSKSAQRTPTKKSFWQRQADCIKRGICEKPTHQNPPGF
ncbi:MAG: hypothetical protein H6R18_1091 [Proteobacteria bacterium]|nr:hypothetical protein [Pseudomonadota bacterium]